MGDEDMNEKLALELFTTSNPDAKTVTICLRMKSGEYRILSKVPADLTIAARNLIIHSHKMQ